MLPRFKYLKAQTVPEALDLLSDHGPEARILAGGTDLLIGMKDGTCRPRFLIDIKQIPELCRIRVLADGAVSIGPCVTVNRLLEFDELPAGMAAIREAASVLATYQLRNLATVGGNICNASPACDLGTPLLVLGARVKVASGRGERAVALADFFESVKVTCLAQDEIVTEIILPTADGTVSAFMKRQRVRGHDLATVNVAGAAGKADGLRLALGAVAPTPVLVGFNGSGVGDGDAIIDSVLGAVSPVDDVRGSAAYRRHMVRFLVAGIIKRLEDRLSEVS
jgi:CO/xanthine dehydrogenase FAD-binding subunit